MLRDLARGALLLAILCVLLGPVALGQVVPRPPDPQRDSPRDFREGEVVITEVGHFKARRESVDGTSRSEDTVDYRFTNTWKASKLSVIVGADGQRHVMGTLAYKMRLSGEERYFSEHRRGEEVETILRTCSMDSPLLSKTTPAVVLVDATNAVIQFPLSPTADPPRTACVLTPGGPSEPYALSPRSALGLLAKEQFEKGLPGPLPGWVDPTPPPVAGHGDLVTLPVSLIVQDEYTVTDNGGRFPDHITLCDGLLNGGFDSCELRSKIAISSTAGCDAIKRAITGAERGLRATLATFPKGDPDGLLIASWTDRTHLATAPWIRNARLYDLLGCGPPGLDRIETFLRDALKLVAAEKLTTDPYKWSYITLDRALAELTNAVPPSSALDWAVEIYRDAAHRDEPIVSAHVASPVALHAYDAEGRHVGWNASTGRAEVQIVGATFEGSPMGAQALTLPPGAYEIQVVELGPGEYTLDVGAGNGSRVLETRLSIPGRTSAMRLVAIEANGTPLVWTSSMEPDPVFWPLPDPGPPSGGTSRSAFPVVAVVGAGTCAAVVLSVLVLRSRRR